MLSILLPAARRSAPGEEQAAWSDLRVALASIQAYAPGIDTVVGWAGAQEPRDLPHNPAVRLLPQPAGITTGSDAWNWCATQTEADELLILGDDCVLHPDTVRLLLEDVAEIEKHFPDRELGVVGARSNYVKGPQNLRWSNGGRLSGIGFTSEQTIINVDMVVPVAAWVRRSVFDLVGGFPSTNWFADDLFCWDLASRGFHHYTSRAYVHHVGQRATGQGKDDQVLLEEGLAWLKTNRPDFVREKLRIAA